VLSVLLVLVLSLLLGVGVLIGLVFARLLARLRALIDGVALLTLSVRLYAHLSRVNRRQNRAIERPFEPVRTEYR